jgi:hypothetical protein
MRFKWADFEVEVQQLVVLTIILPDFQQLIGFLL